MLTIISPDGAAAVVSTQEQPGAVRLWHGLSEITLPTLPRAGNYAETVYLSDDELGFIPGQPAVLAAHLAISGDAATLTLFDIGA